MELIPEFPSPDTSDTIPNCELMPELPLNDASDTIPNIELPPELSHLLCISEGSETGSRMLLMLTTELGSLILSKNDVVEPLSSTGSLIAWKKLDVLSPSLPQLLGSDSAAKKLDDPP